MQKETDLTQTHKPNPNRTSLSRSSALAAGGAALLASNVFRQGLAFLGLVVTARLLTPEDFGVFAYFLVASALVEMLQRQISLVLIRLDEVTYPHLHTVFTLQIILGCTTAGLFWLAQPLIALFGIPELEEILPAVSAYAFLTSFRNPRFLLYERELRFSLAVADETIHRITYVVAAVYLAWLWRDFWALIAATFISFAIRSTFTFAVAPMLPKLSLSRWRDSFSFSSWSIGAQLCQFFAAKMPLLFIGATLGLAEAGIFRIGMRITGIVTKQFFSVLQRVVYPGLADVSRSTGRKKEAFIRINALLLGMSLPMSVGIALIAEDIILHGLGAKWIGAAPVIWVMAPLSGLAILQMNVRAATYVAGEVWILFARNAVLLALVCLYMWIGTQFGFYGALAAAGLSSFTALVFTLIIARQFGNGGFLEPLTIAWRSFVSCAAMTAAVLGTDFALRSSALEPSVLVIVLTKIGVGMVVYTATHIVLWILAGRPDGFETLILSLLARLRGRFRRQRT